MADEPPYILDVTGLHDDGEDPDRPDTSAFADGKRPWIGIQFECCGVYTRIYRNRQGDAYEGYCPKCSRPVRVRVGPGGTSHRMFRAT